MAAVFAQYLIYDLALLLGTLGSSVSVLKPLWSPLQAQQRKTPSVSFHPQDLALIAPIQMTARRLLGDSWPPFCPLPDDLWMDNSVSGTHRVHGWGQPRLTGLQGGSLPSSPVTGDAAVCPALPVVHERPRRPSEHSSCPQALIAGPVGAEAGAFLHRH